MGTALDDAKVARRFDTWLRNELEDTVPCAWARCEAEAEYRMTMPCCSKGIELCEPHTQRQRDHIAKLATGRCVLCGTAPVDTDGIGFAKI